MTLRLVKTKQARAAPQQAAQPYLFAEMEQPHEETSAEARVHAAKVTVSRLLVVRKSLEQTPGAADQIQSINKLIREIKACSVLTDSQRLALVRLAVCQRFCQTFEDIHDELCFELKTNLSMESVKGLVKELVELGELEIVPRFVVGRPKPMGHVIRPKTTMAATA